MSEDELFDLRDGIYDASSVDDLRKRVAGVAAFWNERGAGSVATGLARFLERLVFDEPPAEAIILELRATLARIGDSDAEARPVLDALRESRPVSS